MEQQTNNAALSNKMLKDKAKHIYYNIYAADDFQPGDTWLRNFKQRHNMLLNSQLRGPDENVTSTMTNESMQNLESASTTSELEEKPDDSRELHEDNSIFKQCKNDQTILCMVMTIEQAGRYQNYLRRLQ